MNTAITAVMIVVGYFALSFVFALIAGAVISRADQEERLL